MDLLQWRREFPILARKNYLNSCSLGALSTRAVARVQQFQSEWHELGASGWYSIWMERLTELRTRVATMVSAQTDEIALCASTSAALTTVASSIDYARRPRVVISDLDFPTLGYQWLARNDVEVVRVPSDDGVTIDPQRYADAVDERTAIVAASHVYFTTGAIQNLAAIGDIAHRSGATFIVDAYQSVGQVPLDVRSTGADFLTTGPLKWLLGGPGVAYLYASERVRTLQPRVAGWFAAENQFSFDITELQLRSDARRFELGTPSLLTVHSALGGQEIIDEIGVAAIRARNAALTELLLERLTNAGFRVRCAQRPEERSAIVMVAHGDPGAAVAWLAERHVIVDYRPGYIRISPHFYNTTEEIEQVVAELRRYRDAGSTSSTTVPA